MIFCDYLASVRAHLECSVKFWDPQCTERSEHTGLSVVQDHKVTGDWNNSSGEISIHRGVLNMTR